MRSFPCKERAPVITGSLRDAVIMFITTLSPEERTSPLGLYPAIFRARHLQPAFVTGISVKLDAEAIQARLRVVECAQDDHIAMAHVQDSLAF